MANKRLTFEVDESLHTRLKAEAAAAGVHLGAYCAAILESGSKSTAPLSIDAQSVSSMPLGRLRELTEALAQSQPEGWKQDLTRINSEIMRRYRV